MPTGTAHGRFLLALTPLWAFPATENQGTPPWPPSLLGVLLSPSSFLFSPPLKLELLTFSPGGSGGGGAVGGRDSQPFPRAWRPGIGAAGVPGRGQGLNWEEK